MKSSTLGMFAIGGGLVVLALVVYYQAQRTSAVIQQSTATVGDNTGNINKLAGQVSGLLNDIGIKAGQ